MKRKLLILGASLTIAVPSIVAADDLLSERTVFSNIAQTSAVDCTGEFGGGKAFGRGGKMGMQGQGNGRMMNGQGQMNKGNGQMGMKQGANFEERKTELLDLAAEYSKGTLDEWKVVLAERDDLKAAWQSDDNLAARQSYMEERQAAMQALRDKVSSGEMTREEMREKMMEQKGNADHRGIYSELQLAVEAGDKEKIAELLDEMLKQFKERNEELKNRLENVKK